MRLETIYKIVIKNIVIKNEKNFPKVLKSKKWNFLYKWIVSKTPLLNNHKLSTRIYWVLNNIKSFDNDLCKCKTCGHKFEDNNANAIFGYKLYCNSQCANKDPNIRRKLEETCLKKYGVRISSQADEVKQKAIQTSLKLYGTKSIMSSQFFKDQSAKTKLEKYGDANYKNREQAFITCLKKYGNICPMQGKEAKEKSKQTKIIKYNDENFNNRIKAKATCLKRYGVKNVQCVKEINKKSNATRLKKYGSKNNHAKAIKTNLKRYGVKIPTQLPEIRRKTQRKYKYNNIKFDSAPELALYIWLKDNNKQFEYQPDIKLKFYIDNNEYYYHPDFIIDDILYEIKGDHMIKSDGTWQCIWDHRKDYMFEAKHQCAIKNNVIILTSKDYNKYLTYVCKKYGKDYLKKFRNK